MRKLTSASGSRWNKVGRVEVVEHFLEKHGFQFLDSTIGVGNDRNFNGHFGSPATKTASRAGNGSGMMLCTLHPSLCNPLC